MDSKSFVEKSLQHAAETRKVRCAPAVDRLTSDTKFGGHPWWPDTLDRPRCNANHRMSFIAQIKLRDVPGFDSNDHRLLSFHYCEDCARNGEMPWGWPDDRNRGYDLRFLDTDSSSPDGLGCVARDWIGSQDVEFESVLEIPYPGDLEEQRALELPTDFFSYVPPTFDEYSAIPSDDIYPGLRHVSGTKLGGYPSWQQNPDWPKTASGSRMQFIAQLDMVLCNELAWASGAALLFVATDSPPETELVIQTT